MATIKTNHILLHKKLEQMGFLVYKDTNSSCACYQFEKPDGSDWNEYRVYRKKKLIKASVTSDEMLNILKEHYEKQGYTVIKQ